MIALKTYISFTVAIVVYICLIHEAISATVYFKDGTIEKGSAVWLNDNVVSLSRNGEVWEFTKDEVLLEKTIRENNLNEMTLVPLQEKLPQHTTKKNKQKNVTAKSSQGNKTKDQNQTEIKQPSKVWPNEQQLAEMESYRRFYEEDARKRKAERSSYSSGGYSDTGTIGPVRPIRGTTVSETQRMCAGGCAYLNGTNEQMACYAACTRGN
ncbi:MAG TPA: hypothetical protein HPP97_11060 [Desulfuromonadales bacterium]|nr:hypothetical protein [Desulfuromonadales bacterium]